ncbi:IS110 family transposase [Asticcacaulis sp. BYS171W]|uniref:IS110 family transposase n=1 Tax=Asticcacaulis aquaticus TaxID=2984212 RepID=A0ABT5HZ06_9CAUL|nr:IS110 family transposase [Asticcacaulis aquaticus]MDC7685320.1 IS110 family transposase [Asticcacaulis aquaticus]
MKQVEYNIVCAGLDIGKTWLDAALAEGCVCQRFANTASGIAQLLAWLRSHGVTRIGMEASGNYERDAREALEAAAFEVVVHQPQEVRAFARFKRLRAKSDKIDAALIAKATAQWEGMVARRDKDLIEMAEILTLYEQVSDMLAQARTMAEHHRLQVVCEVQAELVSQLVRHKQGLMATILRRIRQRTDLVARFDLLRSLPGVGLVVAAVLVIRMPELGALKSGQAASLLGVAPFDRDSGAMKGMRFITGGRARPRTFVYLAALAAKRMKGGFKAFAEKLLSAGKPPKVAIVAVMRKLIEAANIVLKRQSLWIQRA